jgi:hypothetical protein
MKNFFFTSLLLFISSSNFAQTTWPVCVSEVFSTGACNSNSGIFTPGNLVINQGDNIQFTTHMILLGGYNGIHNIQFAGSPANNVMLPISTNILSPITTVTTPPFNTPGVFPMECVDANHCFIADLLEGWSCNSYTVTVVASCSVTAAFSATSLSACTGDIINFTNSSTGATSYVWHLDEFTFATSTNALLSFGAPGSYDIELIANDGAGCLDSTTVTINVDMAVDAGDDDSVAFCSVNDSINLNSLLTANSGGIWTETSTSGQFNTSSGIFDYSGLAIGSYYFNYVMTGTGGCPNDTAFFTVFIKQEPSLTLNLTPTSFDYNDSLYIDFTTTGVLPSATYLWNFCDGNLAVNSAPFYHSWSTPGDYCVCVQVNNGNNCVESFCDSTINVYDAASLSEANELKIKIFPNPSNGVFSIDLTSISSTVQISLFDAAQKEVYHQVTQGGLVFVMDARNFSKGNYYLKISGDDKNNVIPLIFN